MLESRITKTPPRGRTGTRKATKRQRASITPTGHVFQAKSTFLSAPPQEKGCNPAFCKTVLRECGDMSRGFCQANRQQGGKNEPTARDMSRNSKAASCCRTPKGGCFTRLQNPGLHPRRNQLCYCKRARMDWNSGSCCHFSSAAFAASGILLSNWYF